MLVIAEFTQECELFCLYNSGETVWLHQMLSSLVALYGSMFHSFDEAKELEEKHPEVSIYHVSFEDMKKVSTSKEELLPYRLLATGELANKMVKPYQNPISSKP